MRRQFRDETECSDNAVLQALRSELIERAHLHRGEDRWFVAESRHRSLHTDQIVEDPVRVTGEGNPAHGVGNVLVAASGGTGGGWGDRGRSAAQCGARGVEFVCRGADLVRQIGEYRSRVAAVVPQRTGGEAGHAGRGVELGGTPGAGEDAGGDRGEVQISGRGPVQFHFQWAHLGAAGEPVCPVVDLAAFAHPAAFPRGDGAVESHRIVEHRCDGLGQQASVMQCVADALRGDRILEMTGVAGQRPARPAGAAEVGNDVGGRPHPAHLLTATEAFPQRRDPVERGGVTELGVAGP